MLVRCPICVGQIPPVRIFSPLIPAWRAQGPSLGFLLSRSAAFWGGEFRQKVYIGARFRKSGDLEARIEILINQKMVDSRELAGVKEHFSNFPHVGGLKHHFLLKQHVINCPVGLTIARFLAMFWWDIPWSSDLKSTLCYYCKLSSWNISWWHRHFQSNTGIEPWKMVIETAQKIGCHQHYKWVFAKERGKGLRQQIE